MSSSMYASEPAVDAPGPHARRARLAELSALAASLGLWWWAEQTGWKPWALGILVAGWGMWAIMQGRDRPTWRAWGFRLDNLPAAAREQGTLAVAGLALLAVAGWSLGHLDTRVSWVVWLAYPFWALAQQFVLQGIVVRNVRLLGAPRWSLPLVAGLAFGAAHLPDVALAGLTFVAGVVLTLLFQRHPNLWTLALIHAVLGMAAFTWVLGRDPVEEFPQLARILR